MPTVSQPAPYAPGPTICIGEAPVYEVDLTGAGDCFGGACVACRRLGLSVAESMTYANAAGARNVTVRAPIEGAGTRE